MGGFVPGSQGWAGSCEMARQTIVSFQQAWENTQRCGEMHEETVEKNGGSVWVNQAQLVPTKSRRPRQRRRLK